MVVWERGSAVLFKPWIQDGIVLMFDRVNVYTLCACLLVCVCVCVCVSGSSPYCFCHGISSSLPPLSPSQPWTSQTKFPLLFTHSASVTQKRVWLDSSLWFKNIHLAMQHAVPTICFSLSTNEWVRHWQIEMCKSQMLGFGQMVVEEKRNVCSDQPFSFSIRSMWMLCFHSVSPCKWYLSNKYSAFTFYICERVGHGSAHTADVE